MSNVVNESAFVFYKNRKSLRHLDELAKFATLNRVDTKFYSL